MQRVLLSKSHLLGTFFVSTLPSAAVYMEHSRSTHYTHTAYLHKRKASSDSFNVASLMSVLRQQAHPTHGLKSLPEEKSNSSRKAPLVPVPRQQARRRQQDFFSRCDCSRTTNNRTIISCQQRPRLGLAHQKTHRELDTR